MNIQEIFKLADPVYALTDKVIIKTTRENYTVNKALLILLSPKYRNELKINPTIKRIELQTNDNLKEFFEGKEKNKEIFLKMGILLGNQHLIDIWKKDNPLSKNNAINQLNKLIRYHVENIIMEEAINLIANYIENFIQEKEWYQIGKNNINILIEILRRAKNNSNEKIGEVLIERLKEEREEIIREKLLKVIEDRINEINDKDIIELMKIIKSTEISEIIQKKFLENVTKIEKEKDEKIANIEKEKNKQSKKIVSS